MEKEKKVTKKNKPKKIIKIITVIFQVLLILSMLFLNYSIFLISGIETVIRYLVIAIIFILSIIFLILLRKILRKNKLSRYIIFIILTSILIFAFVGIGGFVFNTYSKIDSVNKDKITYETAVVVLKDSNIENTDDLKDIKIGINNDKTSIDGYIIGLEIINKYNLSTKATVVEYIDFTTLVSDLYNEKVDAIILPKSYDEMFGNIDGYEKIASETRIITTKEKTLTKNEVAQYTGDEVVNLNKSGEITEPFTVLIMGIDSTREKLDKNTTGNGDALILVTFNPKTLNATILSIPRDSYVPIACFANQKENKITHAAWNGESCMIKTIQNFTGINIDYYVKINFKGVVKLVDTLGGIEVNVPDFMDGVCEQDSNRRFGKYLVCLEKGLQNLNGEQALALARHRKTLATGDIQRGQNQQLVVQGLLNKLKSIKSANQALELLDTVSNSMDTNFTTNQLLSFYDIAKNILLTSNTDNLINIQQLFLSGSDQYIYDESIDLVLYNYIPNESSLKQVVKVMKQNLGLDSVETVKKMNFNIEDKYSMSVIGKNPTAKTSLYSQLPNFIGKDISYANNWLSSKGIKVNIIEQTVTSGNDGEILKVSLSGSDKLDSDSGYTVFGKPYYRYKRTDLIGSSGVTLTVAKKEVIELPPVLEDENTDENTNDEDINTDTNQNIDSSQDNQNNITDTNE